MRLDEGPDANRSDETESGERFNEINQPKVAEGFKRVQHLFPLYRFRHGIEQQQADDDAECCIIKDVHHLPHSNVLPLVSC